MTANLVREPNTGSWIRVETAEAGVVRAYCACGTVPEPCLTQLHEGHSVERVWPTTQVPAAWNQDVDLIKSWPKLASAEPGRSVTWSFGPLVSPLTRLNEGPTRNLPIR